MLVTGSSINIYLVPFSTNFADINVVSIQFDIQKKDGLYVKIRSMLRVHVNAMQQDCGDYEGEKKQCKERVTKLYCSTIYQALILIHPLKEYYQFLDWAYTRAK